MRRLIAAVTLALAGLTAVPLTAQQDGGFATGVLQSPILVIDLDRAFLESALGQRLSDEIEQEGNAIAAENRRIEAELTAEELRLTDQRPNMTPEEFRALADAFDAKVQQLRSEQDAKAAALGARSEENRRRFLTAARPALEALMREANAAVILERRSVFVAADTVDITDRAIVRIDASSPANEGLPEPEPAPDAPPEPLPDSVPGAPSGD